jgi:ArsR family transcriptional regulator, arsenate/arsenite/antimonite-responsive transcriptional repressor
MSKENGFKPELFFAALADRTRLRLLNLMQDGEVCVCFLADTLDTNDPKISRHLAYLKRADLVRARRDGKWMHYSLNAPKEETAREVFDATMKMLKADKQMEQDRKRLTKVCCVPTAAFVAINGRREGVANIR